MVETIRCSSKELLWLGEQTMPLTAEQSKANTEREVRKDTVSDDKEKQTGKRVGKKLDNATDVAEEMEE